MFLFSCYLQIVLCFHVTVNVFQIVLFGVVTEWASFYNVYFYSVIWAANGLVQSLGWPTVVAIMGNWFGRSRYDQISFNMNVNSRLCDELNE